MQQPRKILISSSSDMLDILTGVREFLRLHPEYQPSICFSGVNDPQELRELKQLFRRVKPAGALMFVWPPGKAMLERMPLPVVSCSDGIRTRLPTVMFDHGQMGRMAAEHFMQQGLQHFGFGCASRGYYSQLRWDAFRDALRQAGHECHLFDDFAPLPDTGPIPESLLSRWLAALPKPVGVHMSYTYLAMRAIWTCQELGLRVPEDVAILGGMDRPEIADCRPALSTFHLPWRRVGMEAMQLLDRLIRGDKPPASPILIPPGKLIMRESSDVLAAKDRYVVETLKFIRGNAHRPISIKEILQQIPLSRGALEHRFKNIMRHSLHDEIVGAHMERARTLLTESMLPVKEVARQSGFSCVPVFCVAFRKNTGLSPSGYRNRAAGMGGIHLTAKQPMEPVIPLEQGCGR